MADHSTVHRDQFVSLPPGTVDRECSSRTCRPTIFGYYCNRKFSISGNIRKTRYLITAPVGWSLCGATTGTVKIENLRSNSVQSDSEREPLTLIAVRPFSPVSSDKPALK
ncbi:unnamed protein product [Nesidiocoris tenuis]|uniref:Uncharacterized protein n=1 Tax=Nesidiocoris tenuis TaxID=355587 RepID=A0A6H5G6Z7_9HEMI|nr:unnamed protein product [Nesidiocoris tenuis]